MLCSVKKLIQFCYLIY